MFARDAFSKIPEVIESTAKSFASGVRKADVVQERMRQQKIYGQSIFDPRFRSGLKQENVSFRQDPAEFLGAYASRLLVDIEGDGTRYYYWRWNAPPAVGQATVQKSVGKAGISSPTGKALTGLSVTLPALAAAGTYDITNPEEQFRPKGFAQRYAALGSEDRRETTQPGSELFERFFLGRSGDPLKYETAKKDIPDLTPQRYGNYMNFLYQDKGLLGLGLVKATPENLQGYPEARVVGFPVTLPQVAGYGLGSAALVQGARSVQNRGLTPRKQVGVTALAGLAGAVGGVMLGNVANEVIARANRPTYPSTLTYDQNVS